MVFSQSFGQSDEVVRFGALLDDVTSLIITKYNGSLKGEHGTGRNMAPFVEKEWGQEAYQIMVRLKNSIDPNHLLSPGVILSSDPYAHLHNFKPIPPTEKFDYSWLR